MEVVLGEGREGQVDLWVRMVGWDGGLQLVDIKDQEDNDIAGLLCDIGVMERTKPGPDGKYTAGVLTAPPDVDKLGSIVAADNSDKHCSPLLNHEQISENKDGRPGQEQSLFVDQLEKSMLLDGTMVRLRDIGESSQVGLVRFVEETERAWLEEVMELTDRSISIKLPKLGQLVAMVLQTKAGNRVARAEVVKVNESSQKALCQCLDYHDHRVEYFDNLYFPPPACMTISPLCVKVELYGVPVLDRKEAKYMLEQVDQNILSQSLVLHVRGDGMFGQIVELMDMEGNSINELLASLLGGNTSPAPSNNSSPMMSPAILSSPLMSPDYSLLSSYIPLPLGYPVLATVLHVESPTQLFLCPSDKWKDLKMFQEHLQFLASTLPMVSTIQPVVGQLVMVRSRQDTMWYRGTVIKLYKSKAKVYCPDYGFVEKIDLNNIHGLFDMTVGDAKYWASLCTLGTNSVEMKGITDKLVVTHQVLVKVVQVDGVKYTLDIEFEKGH